MNIQKYITENNLPDFLTTWSEISELTGIELSKLPINEPAPAPVEITTAPAPKLEPIPIKKVSNQVESAAPNLAEILAGYLAPYTKVESAPAPVIDENKIIELIKIHAPVNKIEISFNDQKTIIEGAHHSQFENVLKFIGAGIHIYLHGPAGTGKTQMAENAAIALNKRFFCISVCAQSTKSDLLGFMNAGGVYVRPLFREAYENGGVFLIDEIDNGNPNILAVLNSALANGHCAFPDGMVKRHKDFICIAAANTFGTGPDRMYVGRNQLDAATLNRFMQVEIDYDINLEKLLFGEVATKIQAMRTKLKGERVIISMRNIQNTLKLIQAGFTENQALQMAVINTIPENLRTKL